MKEPKDLIEKIKYNFNELEKLKSEILNNKLPSKIEIDILLNKIKDIYEDLLLLRIFDTESIKKIEDKEKNVKIIEEATEIIDKTNLHSEPIFEIQEETENKKNEKKEESQQSKKTLSEQLKKDAAYLYEKLSAQKEDSTSILFSKPIDNLSKVIGLNEKYAIIKDLLKGDSNKFNEIIEKLNNFSNFHEAYNYIIKDLKWDTNHFMVKYILDLLRRKFIIKNE